MIKAYGYGTIAVVFISSLSLIGIFLMPCFKKKSYYQILEGLNALAASTLLSDALLHMIPDVLGLSSESDQSDSIHVPEYILKISVSLFCLYLFWLIDTLARQLTGKGGEGGHGHSHGSYQDFDDDNNNTNSLVILDIKDKNQGGCLQSLKYVNNLGWIIIIGDGIHNFTDGLAIGASFNQSLTMGFSTTLAIIFHEIPRKYYSHNYLIIF